MARGRHANAVTGAFGGAPYATILVGGVPAWPEAAMRILPLAPSVELLRCRGPREGCAYMARVCHANPATGAFGRVPHGVTRR
eukprot:8597137-Pyramimonas_sp.AAC.1